MRSNILIFLIIILTFSTFIYCGYNSEEDVVYKMINEIAYLRTLGVQDPKSMSEHYISMFENDEQAQDILCQIERQGGEYKENLIENALVRRTRKEDLSVEEIERIVKQLSLAIYYTANEFCAGVKPNRSELPQTEELE